MSATTQHRNIKKIPVLCTFWHRTQEIQHFYNQASSRGSSASSFSCISLPSCGMSWCSDISAGTHRSKLHAFSRDHIVLIVFVNELPEESVGSFSRVHRQHRGHSHVHYHREPRKEGVPARTLAFLLDYLDLNCLCAQKPRCPSDRFTSSAGLAGQNMPKNVYK